MADPHSRADLHACCGVMSERIMLPRGIGHYWYHRCPKCGREWDTEVKKPIHDAEKWLPAGASP